MIPDRDYYADKDGKLTTDMSRAAFQVAVKGVFLDPRDARRYGITDELVSVDEPGAVRSVRSKSDESDKPEPEDKTSGASVEIKTAAKKEQKIK